VSGETHSLRLQGYGDGQHPVESSACSCREAVKEKPSDSGE
jgi:hypothetical protein